MTDRLPSTLARVHPTVRQDAERIWRMKSSGCAENDHYDIQPQVSFFDDSGELIVSVVCAKGRDGALAVIRLGTAPFRAAIVVAHMDAHITQAMINPATGETWGPGEMQAACDTEGACATGLLTDCIASTAVFRDGHVEMLNRMYHGHEKAGGLHWVDADHLVEDGKSGRAEGYVPDVMREAMADDSFAKIAERLAPEARAAGLDEADVYWSGVSMALKAMIVMGVVHAAVPNPPTQKIAEHMQESMTPQRLHEFSTGPLGTVFELLAARWGVA